MKSFLSFGRSAYYNILIRRNLYRIGDSRFLSPYISPTLKNAARYWPIALDTFIPKTIFDIGAHKGVIADHICELYKPDFIALVEPLPEFAQHLKEKKFAPQQVIFNCALGDKPGTAPFHVVASPTSSSLLEITPESGALYDRPMHIEKTITVNVRILDELYGECDAASIDLMKIDVQGYELHVLQGGSLALQNTKMIVVETLFCKHYTGQAMFEDIYAYLRSKGFKMRTMLGWAYDKNGIPLQADAVFINEKYFK